MSSFFLGWTFSKITFPFPLLAIAFVSWFLSSILLGIKQIFSKGWTSIRIKIPWLTLIFNSMIVVRVLFCVQLFLGWRLSKNLSPFLYYSFCLLLCSILLASSPWFIWCFFGISMGFPSQFHEISIVFLWDLKQVSMEFQWDSCRISKGHLWGFHWIPLRFLWDFFGNPMGFPWYFYWISITFLCDFSRISVGCKQDFYGISMAFLWYSCVISLGVL